MNVHVTYLTSLLSLQLPSSGDFPTVLPTRVGLHPQLGFHRGRSSDIDGHHVLLAPLDSVWELIGDPAMLFSNWGIPARGHRGPLCLVLVMEGTLAALTPPILYVTVFWRGLLSKWFSTIQGL